ncbi:hypothetical protein TNCV_2331721, partial [Trichonephila clavipes]
SVKNNREKTEEKTEEEGKSEKKKSQQDGGVRERGRMSEMMITLRRIETKWR